MYENVKLDKSLYNISGKSFTQALAELDPDSQYTGTELANLDAYERQLKRFNIRVSGSDCDVVDKFFKASQSAVLFPEFIRRAIVSGMESKMLTDIVAVHSVTDGMDYRGFNIIGYDPYSITVPEYASFPETTITSSSVISLVRYGRTISTSYESFRNQRLDLYACVLKSVGARLGNELVKLGLTTLVTNAISVAGTAGGFVYQDLLNLYKSFTNYDLTTLIASPATCAALLSLPELSECKSDDGGISVVLPFGPRLYKAKTYTGNDIIALDKNYALEMVTNSNGVLIESDKLIEKRVDKTAVCISANFSKIDNTASMLLTYTAATE